MSQGWRMRAYMDRTGSVRETMDDSRKAWLISKTNCGGRLRLRPHYDGLKLGRKIGAGNEIRTRDPNLGKVVLYQLSYSRSDPNQTC